MAESTYSILLGAKLDLTDITKGYGDVTKFFNQNPAKIKTVLDTTDYKREIDRFSANLQQRLEQFEIKVDDRRIASIFEQITKETNIVNNKVNLMTSNIESKLAKLNFIKLTAAYKDGILPEKSVKNIDSMISKYQSLEKELSIASDIATVEKLNVEIRNLDQGMTHLSNSLKSYSSVLSSDQGLEKFYSQIKNAKLALEQFYQSNHQLKENKSFTNWYEKLSQMKLNPDNLSVFNEKLKEFKIKAEMAGLTSKTFESSMQNMSASIEKNITKINSIKSALAFSDTKSVIPNDIKIQLDSIISKYAQFNKESIETKNPKQLDELKIKLSALNVEFKKGMDAIKPYNKILSSDEAWDSFKNKVDKAKLSLDRFYQSNTSLSKDTFFSDWYNRIMSTEITPKNLEKFNTEILKFKETAKTADKAGRDFTDTLNGIARGGNGFLGDLTSSLKKFTELYLVGNLTMKAWQGLRDVVRNVYELDTAMTNLYKVTDETASKYDSFLKSASAGAKELGRDVASLVTQTSEWAKLGYSLDQSETLAKVSSIYANVGEIDDKTAVGDLVTAMKAFNIEAENAIDIVDIYNKIGNEFAVSSAGIGEGMRNAASTLKLANNDIGQSIAMIGAASELVQNPGEMGRMLPVYTVMCAM